MAAPAVPADIVSKEEQIAKIHLFAGLRPEALRLVAQVAIDESHQQGTVIFKHGGDRKSVV